MDRIQVTILTGFLGAGKTTVLNSLLQQLKGQNNVVIENEFGQVSIDGGLVRQYSSDVYEISNGCICCSLDDELFDVLTELVHEDPLPDRLFIEATGVADSGALAGTFLRKDISQRYELSQVIAVVDATNVTARLDEAEEVRQQIISADLLVLNKMQIATEEQIAEAREILRNLNPFAPVAPTSDGTLPVSWLDTKKSRMSFKLPSGIKAKAAKDAPKLPSPHLSKSNISSTSQSFSESFDLNKLRHVLTVSLMLYAKQIYRIKGVVRSHEDGVYYLLQSTGKSLQITPMATEVPSGAPSTLVVIGKGLKDAAIDRLLRQGVAKG